MFSKFSYTQKLTWTYRQMVSRSSSSRHKLVVDYCIWRSLMVFFIHCFYFPCSLRSLFNYTALMRVEKFEMRIYSCTESQALELCVHVFLVLVGLFICGFDSHDGKKFLIFNPGLWMCVFFERSSMHLWSMYICSLLRICEHD